MHQFCTQGYACQLWEVTERFWIRACYANPNVLAAFNIVLNNSQHKIFVFFEKIIFIQENIKNV